MISGEPDLVLIAFPHELRNLEKMNIALHNHVLSTCKIGDLNKVSHFAASSLLTPIEMVKADSGVTCSPEIAKNSPLPKSSHQEIGLIWRKDSAGSNEFKMLEEFIQKK